MDKKKKKADKYAIRIFNLLLIGFIILYFSKSSGYYEFAEHKQVELNEAQIKKFENDVKENKPIDIENYITNKEDIYDNNISRLSLKLSNTIGKTFENILNYIYRNITIIMI